MSAKLREYTGIHCRHEIFFIFNILKNKHLIRWFNIKKRIFEKYFPEPKAKKKTRDQGWIQTLTNWGGKMRDPGNEVAGDLAPWLAEAFFSQLCK